MFWLRRKENNVLLHTLIWRSGVRASLASLCCGPLAKHIYPSLELVQPRKNRPSLTVRLVMGRKEINQTKKNLEVWLTNDTNEKV